MSKQQKFLGKCMGVELSQRGMNDPHILVNILMEDDENWFKKASFSSSWLDEMIQQLQAAKAFCETQEKDMHNGRQYGFNFKEK